ncbi:MAG: RNA polymerase sigma factor [Solirubrobacteraceae bacterium]
MRRLDDLEDAGLLALAQSDAAAFGVFYRRHGTALLGFLVRRAGDAEAGADLMAETFAAALVHAKQFDPQRGEPVAWLYGIARNQLAMYHRSGAVERRARRRLGIQSVALNDDELERVERLASLEVNARVLAGALDELPAQQRAAVIERVVHEHSYEEIGRAEAVSEGVARQRVSRGLAALRKRLGGTS